MEISRYVRLIKVVLILTTILLSPIKGLADGRKGEKIDRIEELSKKLSSSELDNVIEHIENLDMSKKKEVSKAQSRDTVKRGNSNNSDNSKKTVKSVSNEGRNDSQSKSLSDYTGYVILGLSVILSAICFCLNKLLKGLSAVEKEFSAFNEKLSAKVNLQPKKGDVSENKNKERSSEEKGSLSDKNQQALEDLRSWNEYLKSENSRLEQEKSTLKEENNSLKKEIENLKSQPQTETAVESPQETKSPSSEANQDKVETPETRVYYIERIPRNTNDIELATEQTDKSYFKVTVQGASTSATLSVVEEKSIAESGFVFIEEGYGGTGAKLISEGKGTIEYTDGAPKFTLTDKIKYKKV